MTIDNFSEFTYELIAICKKYDVDVASIAGQYEPIDINVHIIEKNEV